VFPGIYEFNWDAGHVIFLGLFYTVLMVVAATMVIATVRAVRGFSRRRAEAVRWHADFDDLPAAARSCRHAFTGEADGRVCPNGFDCRKCDEHPKFGARPAGNDDQMVAGFFVPGDRLYHRGHTWARIESDGLVTIGLDDLGEHLVGRPDSIDLPSPGERLVANGTAWEVRRGDSLVRVLAPIDGEVVETGTENDDWYLKVRPEKVADMRHLLSAAEARPWMLREVERLQLALGGEGVEGTLADGGLPVDDLAAAIPSERLDEVCGLMFLEP
jgi:glycine cleavage system H lipoate-binding protein